jgi:hypothetical protein
MSQDYLPILSIVNGDQEFETLLSIYFDWHKTIFLIAL